MKKVVGIFLIIIITFFMSGCIEKRSDLLVNHQASRNYLICCLGAMPNDISIEGGESEEKDNLISCLFEGLVMVDKNNEIFPGLAKYFVQSKDKKTYTFYIRDDSKFSDGTDITADDFVNLFRNVVSSGKKLDIVKELECIDGVKEAEEDSSNVNSIGVKAIDKKVLQISLKNDDPDFLYYLAEPGLTLRKFDDKLLDLKDTYKGIMYTGPFEISEIDKDGDMTLAKNMNYYGADEVISVKVVLNSTSDREICMGKFDAKMADIVANPPLSEIDRLNESGMLVTETNKSLNSLVFNTSKSYDSNLRKAISLCIDPNEIYKDVFENMDKTSSVFMPYKSGEKVKDDSDISQKDEAKQYFAKSPYANTKTKLEIAYLDSIENNKICDKIASNIKHYLGITIKEKPLSQQKLSESLNSGEYFAAIVQYPSSGNEKSEIEKWKSDSVLNYTKYKNGNLDYLINEIDSEKNISKVQGFEEKAEKIIEDDVPEDKLFYSNTVICKSSRVQGIWLNKEGCVMLRDAYLK